MPGSFRISREVYVPQLENGFLRYTIMEIIAASDADSAWSVKELPCQSFPIAIGPSAISFSAVDGLDTEKTFKNQPQAGRQSSSWTGDNDNLE